VKKTFGVETNLFSEIACKFLLIITKKQQQRTELRSRMTIVYMAV